MLDGSNPRNIFFSEKEKDFIISINKELLGDVMQQQIIYYAIDIKNTKANLYGESDSKIFKRPVKFWARIEYVSPETNYITTEAEREYSINVMMLWKYFEEAKVEPREGDFIQYNEVLFEIYSIKGPAHIAGQRREAFDTILTCKATARIHVADIRITDEV